MEPISDTTATATPNELEQLVLPHHVPWAVYPEWGSDAKWQKAGFDLVIAAWFHTERDLRAKLESMVVRYLEDLARPSGCRRRRPRQRSPDDTPHPASE